MAIKLFGKTIQLPSATEVLVMNREDSNEDEDKTASNMEDSHELKHHEKSPTSSKEETSDEQNDSGRDEEKGNPGPSSTEKDKESSSLMANSLTKSDEVLPCPRCHSADTKFCYYNNYNVNQPRHFCKNCQRHWTAGGSIRSVPVGAGRRKSKSSAVNHRDITVHDSAGDNLCESIHHSSPPKPTGTLLSSGPDARLHQSMASVGEHVEKKKNNNQTKNAADSNMHGPPPHLNGSHWPLILTSPFLSTQ